LYLQAKEDVMSSRYPISRADAVLLAALSLQESLGDYDMLQTKLGYQEKKRLTVGQITDKAAASFSSGAAAKSVSFEKEDRNHTDQSNRTALSLLGIGDAPSNIPAEASGETKNTELETTGSEGAAGEVEINIRTDFFRHHPIDTVISKHYMGGVMDENRREKAEKDVAIVYSTLMGVNPEQARLYYMTSVRACRVYGAHYYSVTSQSDLRPDSAEEIMAITSSNIIFIDAVTQTVNSEINHRRILSWGYSRDSVMLELSPRLSAGQVVPATSSTNTPFKENNEFKDALQPYKVYFKSRSAKEIADLLQAYNAHMR